MPTKKKSVLTSVMQASLHEVKIAELERDLAVERHEHMKTQAALVQLRAHLESILIEKRAKAAIDEQQAKVVAMSAKQLEAEKRLAELAQGVSQLYAIPKGCDIDPTTGHIVPIKKV